MPDISGVINGKSFCIEVKAGHDSMRDEQKVWREKYEKAGGIYIIARDVGDVIAVFNKLLEGQ